MVDGCFTFTFRPDKKKKSVYRKTIRLATSSGVTDNETMEVKEGNSPTREPVVLIIFVL